ncbi:MAG: CoB--CoM heterodisulfide reductase iron-sulfur subunit B family protein [Candidatus Bathyarchaeia archaeon]
MTILPYYPGCIPYSRTTGLNLPIKAIAKSLNIDLVEIPGICCGAFFTTNPADMYGSVRTLLDAKKVGNELMTTCALCYNVLKQTNSTMAKDAKKREQITAFLGEEYRGEVKVLHFLEYLRDKISFNKLTEFVKVNLEGLKIAPYYGCLLLRPYGEIKLDNPENPTIFEEFLISLGCEPVDFPNKMECCGSYLAAVSFDSVVEHSYSIINSAFTEGAEAISVVCPLCHFNLDQMQEKVKLKYGEFGDVPIIYFTQILAIALGIKDTPLGFDQHFVNPIPWLAKKLGYSSVSRVM